MRRFLPGVLFGIFLVCACGTAPSLLDRQLDLRETVEASMLLADQEKNDLPLTYCKTNICYVYKEDAIKKIKKYIVSLEQKIKSHQTETKR